jgi:hypothetical protein
LFSISQATEGVENAIAHYQKLIQSADITATKAVCNILEAYSK